MKAADYLLLAIIGLCLIAAIIKIFKKGTCSCGGCRKCSGCGSSDLCISRREQQKKVQKVDKNDNNSDCPNCRQSNNN